MWYNYPISNLKEGYNVDKEVLFQQIDSLYEKYLKAWEDVCNIESPTNFKEGVDACGDYFVKCAKALGWVVEKLPQPVSGDPICITMNPEASGKPICLSGHIDTVHPVGSFGTPAVHFDDEMIYGPGVTDCKGGVVGGLYAMEVLHNLGYADRPVKLIIQTDEEGGSKWSNKATINWICEKAEGSRAFLNLEGHTKGEVCIQRKGIITFKFKVTGVATHSSRCALGGANAIIEAAHKMLELEKHKDNEGLTCSCNMISGGNAVNTVAGYCEFVCNVRFATAEQLEQIKAEAEALADTVYVKGCKTEFEIDGFRVAMERVDRNLKLVDDLNEAFKKYGLPELTPSKRTGGSDAADATVYGLTAVDSIGTEGDRIHSVEEFGIKISLKECAKRLVAAVLEL